MRILIVDDEERFARNVAEELVERGHRVAVETSGSAALEALARGGYDAVVTDLRMTPVDGMAVLNRARALGCEVVMMTAYGDVGTAVAAMKAGAADFVTKPFDLDELALKLERLAGQVALREENAALRQELARDDRWREMVGTSAALARVRALVEKVAPSEASVLVLGESGTGKELVARMIHRLSPRASRPFVAVHAAALPETLLESELFGYEKGAFTGAAGRKRGRLEAAEGGTLFLDEVGELPPSFQVKLLRFLQDRTFVRVGGNETITVDARVVAATNRDLAAAARDGGFREDLYYRLSVFPITVPPLRERRGDIRLLVGHILRRLGCAREPGAEVIRLLAGHDWPGNVRELENVLERALILAAGEEIGPEHIQLPERTFKPSAPAGPGAHSLAEVEERMLHEALAKAGGNKSKAAKMLGITRRMLYTRLRKQEESEPGGTE
ncbi:MAG TPA: sigma-54-dependent Fis family transcriptional regulator [candidate division WOR-3 bacterium]|uniref:Sigma-54-dependent Fis family transcriptional regulator n=1 Tax=candidate division WOR-3 bacterium TaxID=2052148 RepID=A0A7V0T6E4_UNCW3|nr:sigma-54-dependent Fis family transcriptional regulator [candidate division WOR-3 bacterium]